MGTAALLAALATLLAPAQKEPADAVRFAGGSVSMAEFETTLANRYGRETIGKEALDYLIRDRVLDREIARRGIVVDASALKEALSATDERIRKTQNHTLDEELEQKGMTRAAFEEIYRKHLACERLVRIDLGLGGEEPVRAEQQELWLAEKTKSAKIAREGLPAGTLPAGTLATVDGSPVTAREVGRTIRLKLSRSELREAARALAGIKVTETKARAMGLTASPEDVEAAVARRRERFETNNAMRGVKFEEFLKAKGLTLDDLRADGGVRGEALLLKMALVLHPDAEVDASYAAAKERYDGLFGESRHVYRILIHAAHAPNELIARTYVEADAQLRDLAKRATSPDEFSRLASIHSADVPARARGGELGWIHRRETGVDPALLAAVFAADLELGKPGGPVRTEEGSVLFLVRETKPVPQAPEMRRLVRAELMAELYRRTIEEAKITTYLDPEIGASPSK